MNLFEQDQEFREELEEIAARLSNQKTYSIHSDMLHQQLAAPFTIIREVFDAERTSGLVEVLSENRHIVHTITPKQYQFHLKRSLHSHAYIELMIVVSGSVLNQFGKESFVYRVGQGCIMNTNIRHKETPVSNAEVVYIELKPEFIQNLLSIMRSEKTSINNSALLRFFQEVSTPQNPNTFTKQYWNFSPVADEEQIRKSQFTLCEVTVKALRNNLPGKTYLAQAAVLQFLSDLCEPTLYTLQNVSSSLNHKEFLVSNIELLIRASRGRISKQHLEENLSYNSTYLNRIFKQCRGKSLSEYGKEIMIQEAKRLLRDSELSVDEIMRELRITSRGYFFSVFQEEAGMTPKEYRNSSR